MKSRLDRITDWSAMARNASYSTTVLASRLKVSQRQMRRYFACRFSQSPQHFIDRLRLIEAGRALVEGRCIKEVASQFCFKQASHFSREFKKAFGLTPSHYALAVNQEPDSQPGMSVTDKRPGFHFDRSHPDSQLSPQ